MLRYTLWRVLGVIPVLLGVSTTIAVGFAVVTLIADLVARLADPRIAHG